RHFFEHDVAALLRLLRVPERGETRWGLNQAREGRGFGQRDVAHVLPKEDARALRDAVNLKRSALAERDFIEIELEDLALTETGLEHERHELLAQFPNGRLRRRQKRVLDDLLGEGAAADQVRFVAAQVGDDGAGDADWIDAGMLEESTV